MCRTVETPINFVIFMCGVFDSFQTAVEFSQVFTLGLFWYSIAEVIVDFVVSGRLRV